MITNKDLEAVGLHENEAKAYLYLLENGLSTTPQIARGTKILRTNTYHVLRSLLQKRLIEARSRGKRQAYLAHDPSALLAAHDIEREAIDRLLPDLRGLYTVQKNKPKIRFYDGFQEVKQLYMQSLEGEEVFAMGSMKHLSALEQDFFDFYIRAIRDRKIIFHDLVTSASAQPFGADVKSLCGELYTYKSLPPKYNSMATDIFVWGDNIALITLSEPIFGTLLQNKLLADTFRFMFELIGEGRK